MNTQQSQQARDILEQSILALLVDYKRQTGLDPIDVAIDTVNVREASEAHYRRQIVGVSIRVELS